jgi:hypothetical protein
LSTSSDISLGALRLQARQRSDLENNPAVSDAEFNQYISQSYKELYDLLVSAYGNDYMVAQPYTFTLSSSQSYPLPDGTPTYQSSTGVAPKFYKLLGVDLQYSSSPSGWVTLKRLEFIDRNKYAYPNTAINWNGYSNLRYRVQGNGLYFVPIPMAGQNVQVWYVPAPTSLSYILPGSSVLSSNVIGSMSDTTGLSSGMSIYSSLNNVLPANTTLTAVSTSTMTLSSNAQSSVNNNIFQIWNDSATLDGISGWEEYIIIDAAIKAQIKQEGPFEPLAAQKADMRARIDAMAEGRDIGQAQHVSDALGCNSYSWDGFGSDGGWGGGW